MKSPIARGDGHRIADAGRHSGGQQAGIVAIGGEQAGEHRLRLGAHRLDLAARRTCARGGRLERPLLRRHRGREAGERPARRRAPSSIEPSPAARAAVSASTSLTIAPIRSRTSSGTSRASRDVGIARPDRRPASRDQRHFEQLVEREQARRAGRRRCRDCRRRCRRRSPRPAPPGPASSPARAGIRHRPRPAPRAASATGPLCLASPSSVSQLRLSPSKRG